VRKEMDTMLVWLEARHAQFQAEMSEYSDGIQRRQGAIELIGLIKEAAETGAFDEAVEVEDTEKGGN